jgi:hypothetical protein
MQSSELFTKYSPRPVSIKV